MHLSERGSSLVGVPTYVYLVTHHGYEQGPAGKVGIGGISTGRIDQHEGENWQFHYAALLPDLTRARWVETNFKRQAKQRGVMPFLNHEDLPQGGYTETFDLSRLPLLDAWAMLADAVGRLPQLGDEEGIDVAVHQGRTDGSPVDPYDVEWWRCRSCKQRTEVLVVDLLYGDPKCGNENCVSTWNSEPRLEDWQVYVAGRQTRTGQTSLGLGISPDKKASLKTRLERYKDSIWVHMGGQTVVTKEQAKVVAGSVTMRLALMGIATDMDGDVRDDMPSWVDSNMDAKDLLALVRTETLRLRDAYEGLRQRRERTHLGD